MSKDITPEQRRAINQLFPTHEGRNSGVDYEIIEALADRRLGALKLIEDINANPSKYGLSTPSQSFPKSENCEVLSEEQIKEVLGKLKVKLMRKRYPIVDKLVRTWEYENFDEIVTELAALTAHPITDSDIEWAKNRMSKEPEHKSVLTPEQEFLQMNTPIVTAHPPQHTENEECQECIAKDRIIETMELQLKQHTE